MGATPAENTRRMRQYIGAWNDHDIEAIIAFFAYEYLQEIGYEEAVASCETWFEAFPDLTHEINQLAADGDWVGVRLRSHALVESYSIQQPLLTNCNYVLRGVLHPWRGCSTLRELLSALPTRNRHKGNVKPGLSQERKQISSSVRPSGTPAERRRVQGSSDCRRASVRPTPGLGRASRRRSHRP